MAITQNDIALLKSHNKRIRLKATLLDDNYLEVESLSGTIKPSPSFDISSESDIRRTCTMTMVVSNKDRINTDFESTWIKRMVELAIGVYDFSNGDYVWYPMGRMLMVSGNTTYTATTQEIKMTLVDLMASITEDRGSQMGLDMMFPVGSNMRDAITALISEFSPFKRCNICEFEDVVPYDITISIGRYPYDALKELLNLFPYYEAFYDVDGVFTVQKIPTKIDDPIDIGADVIDELLISENRTVNFSNVKNTTEIWGRSLDAQYTALSCTSADGCYNLMIDDTFEVLEEGYTYGFTPDVTSVDGQTIKIQDTEEYAIYTESGAMDYTPIAEGAMQADIPYVVRYTNEKFVLQGELEIHVIYQEIDQMPSVQQQIDYRRNNACRDVQWVVNPESPFACTITSAGQIDREIRQVLEGGEYGNIYTTQLALERASYETWLRTRCQDTVELEMILIPWMDVNDKIEYTSPVSGELTTMLVQSISYDLNKWTMTVKCSKFYPYYPWW